MERIDFKITGTEKLLLNNPQTVDPFNLYAKAKKVITNKRAGKTEEDLMELRRLEVESKLYFDDELGIYIPSTWLDAAMAANSHARVKVAKAKIRAAVFPTERKIKLSYAGMGKVKAKSDISGNPEFYQLMLLKQNQVKVPKSAPVFHNWSFTTALEFDPSIIDRGSLTQLLEYVAHYNGFGDFRPTFGRATFAEI